MTEPSTEERGWMREHATADDEVETVPADEYSPAAGRDGDE